MARYLSRESGNPQSTIGVQFATKVIELKNGKRMKAQIWDTGIEIIRFSG